MGLAAGALGSAFHLVCDRLTDWRGDLVSFGVTPLFSLPAIPDGSGLWLHWPELPLAQQLFMLAVGIMVVLWFARMLVRRLAPEAGGSGIQEIEGFLGGLRPLRWWRVVPVKFLSGAMALGAGFVLGREGPTVHMGGASGSGLASLFRCSDAERNVLVAAGAGAGLAAAFNAPLAGIVFVIEEMRREVRYSFRGYHALIIACFAATFVTDDVFGLGPQIPLPDIQPTLASLPHFAVLGVILGIVGVRFNHGLLLTLDLFAAWYRQSAASLLFLLALGLAALLLSFPQASGGGEQIIGPVLLSGLDLPALALLLVLRILATFASYAAGTPGGVFAPMLAIGTIVGLIVGHAAAVLAPGLPVDPEALAIAGMAAFFTATVRAPLTGIVLISELTGGFSSLLATTLACATASLTAQSLGGQPLYEQLLDRTLRQSAAGTSSGTAAEAR